MDTVRIERFSSRVDADLACSMLTARGFNARVSGDDVAGVHPDIPFGIGGTAVVVPREQYDDAIALLDDEFEGPLGDDEGPDGHTDAPDAAGPGRDAPDVGARGTHARVDGPGEHDASTPGRPNTAPGDDVDAAWPHPAQRRPGMRVFALAAAAALLAAFLGATGVLTGWW